MEAIEHTAQAMLAQCASQGHSVALVSDRHYQDALRAELRRLARHWRLRIRTVARTDRVAVARVDQQPWDDDEATAVRELEGFLRGALGPSDR